MGVGEPFEVISSDTTRNVGFTLTILICVGFGIGASFLGGGWKIGIIVAFVTLWLIAILASIGNKSSASHTETKHAWHPVPRNVDCLCQDCRREFGGQK